MKEFTNVAGRVTSFAGRVNFFCPSWISCTGAWFEAFWDILWHYFHPERVVSLKERAERGWKSGERSLSWKSGWNPCTFATSRRWTYPNLFPFPRTGHLKISLGPTQLLYIVNFMVIFHTNQYNGAQQQCVAFYDDHCTITKPLFAYFWSCRPQ